MNSFHSVGIDIGTSTTKLIISQLRLENVSGVSALPRYQIVERKLLYESEVYTTPLLSEDEIDFQQISEILLREYEKAQIHPAAIQSGAVIITGETANKKKSRNVLHLLAERAGDFVVATAGADLEGILAGRGSGAEKRSKDIPGVIANIDIGGGTANVAYFHQGRVAGTVTFHIGGRLIRLTREGVLQYISPAIQPWLNDIAIPLQVGQTITFEKLHQLATHMCQDMMNRVVGKMTRPSRLVLGNMNLDLPVPDVVMISGGVGHMMWNTPPETIRETAIHGDFGPLLADVLKKECEHLDISLLPPEQTVRATVIGAGMQSMQISGATIYMEPGLLPLKNLPVTKLDFGHKELTEETIPTVIKCGLEQGALLFDSGSSPPFAVALTSIPYCSYYMLKLLSGELANHYRRLFPDSGSMVVICERDMAKALGQSLAILCQGQPKILSIDQVHIEHGDYIDLGEPIWGRVIPVVVKTLAFY